MFRQRLWPGLFNPDQAAVSSRLISRRRTLHQLGILCGLSAAPLARGSVGGPQPFWNQLVANRGILFWPLLGGFV